MYIYLMAGSSSSSMAQELWWEWSGDSWRVWVREYLAGRPPSRVSFLPSFLPLVCVDKGPSVSTYTEDKKKEK